MGFNIDLDNDGKLIAVAKIRGNMKTYSTLIDRAKRDGVNLKEQTVFVAHAECPEKAEKLKEMVAPLVKEVKIVKVGPIIGSHVGQGMFALTFQGERNLS